MVTQFEVGGMLINVTRVHVIGAEADPGQGVPPGNDKLNPDVMIGELATSVPASVATPFFIAHGAPRRSPAPGAWVTAYGASNTGSGCSGPRGRRYAEFTFDTKTTLFCPGDSGSPAVYDRHADNGAIWGVASWTPSTGDVWGNVSRYKEDILSVIRMWNFNSPTGLTGVEAGFRRNGVVLQTTTASGAVSCRNLCNSNASCNSYRFQHSTRICNLLKDAGDWVANDDFTSGLSNANRFEEGVDRPGFDYRNFISSKANCSLTCSNEARCAAFSWSAAQSRCWLKDYLSLPTPASGITSGTKRRFDHYTDRPGSDFTSYDVAPDPRVCQADCSRNSQCVAYAYRTQIFTTDFTKNPPVTTNQSAHCWLKNATPGTSVSVNSAAVGGYELLVSGLKRSTPE